MKIPLIPYVTDVPVAATAFYGRQDIVAWLSSEPEEASTRSFWLYGPPAIGKTSLLHYLQTTLADDDYVPIYCALMERPLTQLLHDLAQQILDQANLDLVLPESANEFCDHFLPQVQDSLGNSRRLALLFDDLDILPEEHAFWSVISNLTEKSPPILIFTSSQIPNQLPTKINTVSKAMSTIYVGPLNDEAAISVLSQGHEQLDFTEEALARILAWSGRHPYLLQQIGQYLWEMADEPIVVGQGFVENSMQELVESATTEFDPLWDGLDLAEQLYAAILAERLSPFETMAATDIATLLGTQAVRLRPHKLNWLVDDLRDQGLLAPVEGEQYCLTPPLFHAWLRHHKPAILVKEQLDQLLNPQADKLFQRGREALLQGQHQKAMTYFRQVISQSPYHVGAQLSLGTSLLASGFTETAVKRLERAYKLDATEAKYPLAEALVAMAEAHLASDSRREALDACEQFNALDSNNPDLHHRIRAVETAVWNQRGNIALERGFLDKALIAFQYAGNTEKIAELNSIRDETDSINDLDSEAKGMVQAEAWSDAAAIYETLLATTRDAGRQATYKKALTKCNEEVELAQYFDEGLNALENKNWLLARMSFMHIITHRMNYTRRGERALTLLDKAAKGHSFTAALVSTPSKAATGVLHPPEEAPSPPEELPQPEPFTEPDTPMAALETAPPFVDVLPPSHPAYTNGEVTIDNVGHLEHLERLGKGAITNMTYSPDGQLLALATALGVYFYNAQTLDELLFIETNMPIQAIAFSPDGEMVVTGSWHDIVQLWQVEDGQLISELKVHQSSVKAVTFSSDGILLASADEGGVIALWHVAERKLIHAWEAHRGPVTAVAFTPDSESLLSASSDKSISLWQVEEGSLLMTFQHHEKAVTQIAFSHNGQRFFSTSRDATAVMWRLDAKGWLRFRRQDAQAAMLYSLTQHRQAVNDVTFSADGKLAATASDDQIVRLWNASNGTLLHEFKGHLSPVISVSFSPDGRILASASESLVQLWDIETRYSVQAIEGHIGALQGVAISSNGQLLATAVANRILLWSLEDQALRHILLGHTDLVYHITFSPQGNMVASASADQTTRIWDVITGIATQTLSGHQGAVMDVSFSPNGQLLATASESQTVRLWRTVDGKLLQTLTGHQDAVTSICFNSNGRLLASGSSDQSVRLWAIPEGRLQQVLTGHNGIIWQVSFSPDNSLLATAALDRTTRLWRKDDGALLHILDAHEGPVWSVQFSPNGQLVVTGASDSKIRLWHAHDGRLLQTFEGHTAPISSVTFTPDGQKIISASVDGTVRVYGLTP